MTLGWSNPTGTSSRAHADGPNRGWWFHLPFEEGFTQAWDTVGAGANPTHVRESSPEKSVRLQL